MDWSEGERRAAVQPEDQPESEGKQPNVLPVSQRDSSKLSALTVRQGGEGFVYIIRKGAVYGPH